MPRALVIRGFIIKMKKKKEYLIMIHICRHIIFHKKKIRMGKGHLEEVFLFLNFKSQVIA